MDHLIGLTCDFLIEPGVWGRGQIVGVNHIANQLRVLDDADGEPWFGDETRIRLHKSN